MKQITTSKGIFLFIEVPDDSDEYHIIEFQNNTRFFWNDGECRNDYDLGEDIPHGNKYEFICTTKNATEEHAAMVVEFIEFVDYGEGDKLINQFCNYEYPTYDTHFDDAVDSLKSLQISEGLDAKNNQAIIQKL